MEIGKYSAHTNMGRYVLLNNKFLYTAHNSLQIKHTDGGPSLLFLYSCVCLYVSLSLSRSQFQSSS